MKNIISVEEAKKIYDSKKAVIIDVRSPAEFESVHIKGAINIPADKIQEIIKEIEKVKKDILFICKSGNRSNIACSFVSHLEHSKSIAGGIQAWQDEGYPVIKGKQKWDIERQVRFTAGLLVTIGIILGYFLTPYFYLLSLFVGLGLVFASVTNTCAMGMLIMKLPYNKSSYSLEKEVKKL